MTPYRCGYVGLLGRPNVGKSTLLNHLIGQKVSITSRRPQTTRDRILGIKTRADAQLLFVDTPGVHRASSHLNRYMVRMAQSMVGTVDVLVLVVEAGVFREDDARALELIKHSKVPVVLLVNKVDRIADKTRLLPFLQAMAARHDFADIIPMSARSPRDIEQLENTLLRHLPVGEALFAEDEITDRPVRFMAAELIREKIFRVLGQELPYASAVVVESFKEEGALVNIRATIFVERDGQKAIIIGSKGEGLKKIGQAARLDLEKMLDKKVFLELWVKVKDAWSDDAQMLRNLGYGDG